MNSAPRKWLSLAGSMLILFAAMPAFSQVQINAGDSYTFSQSEGVIGGRIEECGGITSKCFGGPDGDRYSFAFSGNLVDQHVRLGASSRFTFTIPVADVPEQCAAGTVAVHITGKSRYDGTLDQAPSVPIVTDVEMMMKLGMELKDGTTALSTPGAGNSGRRHSKTVIDTPENGFVVQEDFSGSATFSLDLNLSRGVNYSVLLDSNFQGDCDTCGAMDADFQTPDNGVDFQSVTVAVAADLFELVCAIGLTVDDIETKVDILDGKVDVIDEKVDDLDSDLQSHDFAIKALLQQLSADVNRNYNATLEAIRLLNTPQGRRASSLPACDGEPCDFPDR